MNPEIDKLYGGKYGMVQPTQAALDGVSSGRLFNGAYPNNQTSQNSNLFYANSTPNPSITAQSLSPQTAFTPTLPQYPPLPGMPEAIINEQFAPLQGDQQISGIQSKIAQLTGQFAQEDSRRSQLLANPDIEAQRKSVNELSNQLSMIQKQASAIPLQLAEQAKGSGIDYRILSRQQESSLRRNTIQAIQTSALLQAAQGNLTLALDQVDRAVKAEFEPLKAELVAQQANLDALKNDPARIREEARRKAISEAKMKELVDDAQRRLDEKKEKARKEEDDKKTIQALALQAQSNGAPNAILSQIISSPNVNSAMMAATGYTAKETVQSIQEYNFAVRNGYKGSFSQYQNEDANRKAVIARAGVAQGVSGVAPEPGADAPLYSGLSSQTATAVRSQVSRFSSEPIVQNFAVVQEGNNFAQSIANNTKNPAEHQAIIYALAKALDPGSVVREGEYATAQKYAQSWINAYGKGVEQAINGTGFLSEDAIRNIKSTIAKKYEASNKSYTSLENNFARGINDLTGKTDGAKFLRSYRTETTQTPQPEPVNINSWLAQPNYNEDIRLAREAIANGANPVDVKARLQQKYKDVQL